MNFRAGVDGEVLLYWWGSKRGRVLPSRAEGEAARHHHGAHVPHGVGVDEFDRGSLRTLRPQAAGDPARALRSVALRSAFPEVEHTVSFLAERPDAPSGDGPVSRARTGRGTGRLGRLQCIAGAIRSRHVDTCADGRGQRNDHRRLETASPPQAATAGSRVAARLFLRARRRDPDRRDGGRARPRGARAPARGRHAPPR